jgi:hypothetical protein
MLSYLEPLTDMIDLPPPSCVNTEIKPYSKRLKSLSIFNYVRVLSMSRERSHPTKHELHLNMKGKDWIVSNLVKEIRNLYLLCKISPPIVLQWRDVNENVSQMAQTNRGHYWSMSDLKDDFGNQVSPVTVNDDTEFPSPGCRTDN